MKQQFEDYIFENLKKNLRADLSEMLVKGHSTEERPTPYICVDVSDCKPFSDMQYSDGIFSIELNISIADSAHDIDYRTQADRRRAVEIAMHEIVSSDKYLINYIDLIETPDARDESNIGDVLKYEIVVQIL